MDESLILDGLKTGDKKAFNLLYDRLFEQVCFFAEQIVKDEMEAEDIAIHSLAKFWEKGAENFESFLQVRRFIFITARHASFDYLRKVKTQRAVERNLVHLSEEMEQSIAD